MVLKMYDDLIAKMDDIDVAISNGFGKASVFLACVKATRATIELHKPKPIPDWVPTKDQQMCSNCIRVYPCATIQAIAKELE